MLTFSWHKALLTIANGFATRREIIAIDYLLFLYKK